MFKMVSEYGNAVYYADTETEKERFLRLGFHEETETAGQIKKPKAAGGGKRNAKTEKDKN